MGFQVPAGSTYSTTHDLGGVLGVDDTVRITATGGVGSMMVSVEVQEGAKDPFDETLDSASPDFVASSHTNYCTRSVVNPGTGAFGGAGTGEPGNTSAKLLFPTFYP